MVTDRRFLLLASMHHCITDGWSAALLQRELQAAAAALLAGSTPSWPPLPVQFVDYAAWQRQHIMGNVLDDHLNWWRETLKGAPPLLELPWDHRRPEVVGHAGAAVPLRVAPHIAAQLQQLAAAQHTTLFCVVLAALQVRHATTCLKQLPLHAQQCHDGSMKSMPLESTVCVNLPIIAMHRRCC